MLGFHSGFWDTGSEFQRAIPFRNLLLLWFIPPLHIRLLIKILHPDLLAVLLEELLLLLGLLPLFPADVRPQAPQLQVLHPHLHGLVLLQRVRLVVLLLLLLSTTLIHEVILISHAHLGVDIMLDALILN